MKKLLLIIVIFFPVILFSQLFVEYNSGYDFSLNGFKRPYKISSLDDYYITREPFVQNTINSDEKYFIYLPTGEGIVNYLWVGYNLNNYISTKLGISTNINKINFNLLRERNSYIGFENTEERGTINTDDYFYLYQKRMDQIEYNIYNINPVIKFHYPFTKIIFGANAGILLSFINLTKHRDVYHYGLKGTQDGYYEYSFESLYTIFNKKPIVSFNVGIDIEYIISDKLSCILNFSYKKIKYTPKEGLYQVYNISGNNYGEILDEPDYLMDVIFVDYELLTESQYDQIYDYNFSTVGFSIGLRYTFVEKQNEK